MSMHTWLDIGGIMLNEFMLLYKDNLLLYELWSNVIVWMHG